MTCNPAIHQRLAAALLLASTLFVASGPANAIAFDPVGNPALPSPNRIDPVGGALGVAPVHGDSSADGISDTTEDDGPAATLDLIVTRTDDPAPDGCQPTDCSLREAVIAANADPASYEDIRLAAATYQVNGTPLAITGGTRIHGVGNTQTLILGDGVTDLVAFSGPHQLDLVNLAIDAQGKRELVAVNSNRVGLFRLRAPNPLGMIDVREPDPPGATGGAFFLGESEVVARIRSIDKRVFDLFDSRILSLSVFGTGVFGANSTDVTLTDTIIDGALAPEASSGALILTRRTVSLARVTVQDAEGLDIGGIPFDFDSGSFVIDRLRYVGNRWPMEIRRMDGDIRRSEFLANINDDVGDPAPGALIVGGSATVRIDASTFAGNRGSSRVGGAILVDGDEAALSVRNSTFSNNSITAAAAALPGGARGGTIGWSQDATDYSLILRHVTLVAPTFLPTGLSGSGIGGLGNNADGTVRVYNSIVRGTCSFAAGSVDVGIGNIESGGNTCGFPSGINQVNVASAALALGALGNNGGHTPTIMPGATSVALDSANAAFCLDVDQRGYARPLGAGCDVGAIEAGDVIFADGHE